MWCFVSYETNVCRLWHINGSSCKTYDVSLHINKYSTILHMCFSFLMIYLITFSLAYIIVRLQCILHIPNKTCINVFMLLVLFQSTIGLLVVKFLGSQKLYAFVFFFLTWKEGRWPLTPALFKAQLILER